MLYTFTSDKKHEIKHGKYTVSEEVLMSLVDKHPLPRIALEYRQVAFPSIFLCMFVTFF
jgi:DNA polymerase I-like protein with 3'-5' exonuclease and polymerase domains